MVKFFLGVIVGIVISSIGFTGMAKSLDKSVEAIKAQSKELSK